MKIHPAYSADLTQIKSDIVDLQAAPGGIDYSTTEQDTGLKWVDAKAIFRKVVLIGAGPNTGSVNNAHGITGIDTVVNMRGVLVCGPNRRTLPQVDTSSATVANQGMEFFVNETNVVLGSGIDFSTCSGFVVIDYTKD